MNPVIVAVGLCAALAVAWLGVRALAAGRGIVLLDHPNERSLHARPTPRTGGLAIVAAVVVALASLALGGAWPQAFHAVAIPALLVFAISVADDVRHVPAALRMGVHLLAAGVLVGLGAGIDSLSLPGWVLAPGVPVCAAIGVLFVAWLTNLYNFMDGMDGFAGGMGVIGFAALAVLAARGGAPALALVCTSIALACAGFLCWNFPPARIFMGDAGSSVLGFLAGGITLYAERHAVFPLWVGALVFSPFIVDASVTLVRRALAGERVWQAHRTHYYQRVVRLGHGHRVTTLGEYVLMLAAATLAVAIVDATPATQWVALSCTGVVYTALMLGVHAMERRRLRAGTHGE